MNEILSGISAYTLPICVLCIILIGVIKRVNIYDEFAVGAEDGLKTVYRLAPIMVGLITAIGVFRESGALNLIVGAVRPIAEMLCIPEEILPLFFVKSLSGSASAGMAADVIATEGADTFIGRAAAILLGSTDAIIYITAVYFGAVKLKNTGYTAIPAVITAVSALFLSVMLA